MTKQEQLIEYMTQDIIEMLTIDTGIEFDKAMKMFYEAETFKKLSDIETGLYRESPAYVYGIFQDELNFGRIMQAEI